MWLIYALLSAITAAFVTIFGKMGLKNVDSSLATTVRSIFMALSLILFSLTTRKLSAASLSGISGRDWLLIILSGLAGAASWLFYFFALKIGPASKVAAIDRTSILFIVVLSVILLGESYSWKALAGALLVIGGVLLITLK